MRLSAYLHTAGVSASQLARDAGLARQTISRLAKNTHLPTLETALAIFHATKGKVKLWKD